MSKLLKSKILLGVMVFAVIFAGFALASKVSATECDLGTVTLKQGMSGTAVTCLQQKLGLAATYPQGYFGSVTLGLVKTFQAAHSLTVDGIAGPVTKAALGMVSGGGTYPAGCTSSTGFSTTTGLSCALTGLPAGCTSTTGYSPTTGASCASGISQGPLAGGAGDVDSIDQVTTSVKDSVLEGSSNAKILGFDVTADNGSDLAISSLRLEFENQGGALSNHLDRYVDNVSVWVGSTKVGSADVGDFSESLDVYSKSITLSNVVVKAGEDIRMYIAVDAASSIDTLDQIALDWSVELISIRTLDASGAIITFDPGSIPGPNGGVASAVEEFLGFESLNTSGELAFKASRATTNPIVQNVEVDDASTTDVDMLEFKLKAEGSEMIVDSLGFNVTPTIATVALDINDLASQFVLYKGSDEIDSLTTVPANVVEITDGVGNDDLLCETAEVCLITFTDLADDLTIADGDTVTLKVVATINEFDNLVLLNGDSLSVSLDGAVLDNAEILGDVYVPADPVLSGDEDGTCDAGEACYASTDIEDENGDQVAAGDKSGSATGNAQTFYVTGVDVTVGTVTYAENTNLTGDVVKVTYTIPFTVSSFGNDVYIPTTVGAQSAAIGNNGLRYEIENSADATQVIADITGAASSITSSGATLVGARYEVASGDTETFSVAISMDAPAGSAAVLPGFYRVQLLGVGYSLTSAGAVVVGGYILTPETNYDTVDRSIDAIV